MVIQYTFVLKMCILLLLSRINLMFHIHYLNCFSCITKFTKNIKKGPSFSFRSSKEDLPIMYCFYIMYAIKDGIQDVLCLTAFFK